ncbi:hypothetical protein [Petropleomorpha daqingensis]|uniref:Uncharacterized protein n=1 Tax=Petropleomorpha daqingensis TaxID=2026353 RepID=A0A853CBU7_9ACTN|nr:hypothetical protein [Petropleomorpha daqingensis]NYJ03848.1 hypothetical protein [Petropleomorpha daqingensis]
MRWEEPRDPEQAPPPRRWGVGAAVAGLGLALVVGATLLPGSPPPPAHRGTLAVAAVDEPTGRGGLPHRVPAAPTTAPAPAPVPAAPVAEVAATSRATTSAPAAAPLVARIGQACSAAGATAVDADGTALVCQSGKGNGNGAPRWRKA